eukprot:Tbor_TRINITY_DN931_c0_g1::TRINITY_DN931_c0_g1_i1::g.21194::m.21194
MRRPSATCPKGGNTTTKRGSFSATPAKTSASKATVVQQREKEILDTLAKKKTAKEQLEAARYQKLIEEAQAADDEEDDEEDEDEEEECDSDEEDDDEEDDEEEDEEEEKLQVKLQKIGDVHSKIIDLSASTTYKEFLSMVAKKFAIDNVGQVVLTYVDGEGDTVVIEDKNSFRRTVKLNWPNENGNDACNILKLTVDTKDNLLATLNAMPRTGSDKCLKNTINVPHQTESHVNNSSLLYTNMLANSVTGLNSTMTVSVKPGEELRWTKMNLLGKGSFGTVYEGITNDGKLLAVKQMEIPAEKAQDEEDSDVKSLMSEINLMSSLKHPHIVAYYGCQTRTTESGGKQFEIFLEHCHGGSLTTLRKKFDKVHGKLSISLARNYIKQILQGLEYLHQQGVVHRDIKSDNVLISATGDAKLADFGCSKKMSTAAMEAGGESGPNAALYQTMVGTPLFMAPEVMNDAGPGYGRPADIWSVGCLLLELLGRKPWVVQGNNMFQIMFQISQSKEMPNGIPKSCPVVLKSFFESIFERDTAKRGTCEELLKHRWITAPENELVDVPLEAK